MAAGFTSETALGSKAFVAPRMNTTILGMDEWLLDRELMKGIEDVWNESQFLDLLQITNREVVAKNKTFYHYENGLMFRAVKFAAVIGTPTASSAVVTLTADSYNTTSGTAYSPLQATDIIMLAPGVQAYVTAKSSGNPTSGSALVPTFELNGTPTGTATQYTIVRANGSTANIGTLAAALVSSGAKVAIPTNAHAEGSYQPGEGDMDESTRFSGTMQIFKKHTEITGTADSTHMEQEINGTTFVWNKMTPKMLSKLKGQINYAFLYNPGGSFTNAKGEEIRTTTGLEGAITTLGNNYTYADGAGFAQSDLDAIISKIKKSWGGKEYFFVLGSTLRAQVEAVVRELPQPAVQYSNWGKGDGRSKAVDLGINSFFYNGVWFHLMEVMLHPEVDGLPIYEYDKTGYLIPADQQSINYKDENGMSQSRRVSAATTRYLSQSNGESRRFKSWSNGPEGNGGRDVQTMDALSECGLQLVGLRKFIRVVPD